MQKPLTKCLELLTPNVDGEGRIYSGLGYYQPRAWHYLPGLQVAEQVSCQDGHLRAGVRLPPIGPAGISAWMPVAWELG